jgi:O-antigen/teichoic acid export membrane protein
MFLNIFGNSLEGTLFPEMSKNASEYGTEAVADLTEEAVRYAGLFTIPGLLGGIVVGEQLLLIYGDGFTRGITILGLLIAAALVYSYVRQFRNTLNAINRPDLAFRVNGIFTASNVILNIVLIYNFGWIGAAVATLSSTIIGILTSYYYVRRQVGVSLPLNGIVRQWTAAAVMATVVYGLRILGEEYWLPRSNAVMTVGIVGMGAIVYFVILLVIWEHFRETVSNNLPVEFIPV